MEVKFINSETDEILFEINDRTWMNVGEILSDGVVSSVMSNEWRDKKPPIKLMILVVGEYDLTM